MHDDDRPVGHVLSRREMLAALSAAGLALVTRLQAAWAEAECPGAPVLDNRALQAAWLEVECRDQWQTHPPMFAKGQWSPIDIGLNGLPYPWDRPVDETAYAIYMSWDSSKAKDSNNGASLSTPIRSFARAIEIIQALPAGTLWCLYLDGAGSWTDLLQGRGIYWMAESDYIGGAKWTLAGTAEKPGTIRALPNMIAMINMGERRFFEDPWNSWEGVIGGHDEEFRATFESTVSGDGVNGGMMAEGLISLLRYPKDLAKWLRATTEYAIRGGHDVQTGFYGGPGSVYDINGDKRWHVRMSRQTLAEREPFGLYGGEVNPREIQLFIPNRSNRSSVQFASYLRVQDIIIGGGHGGVAVGSEDNRLADVEFDNCWFLGMSGLTLRTVGDGIRFVKQRILGYSTAPWASRFWDKYVGGNSNTVVLGSGGPYIFDRYALVGSQDNLEMLEAMNGGVRGQPTEDVDFLRGFVSANTDDALGLVSRNADQGLIRVHLSWFHGGASNFFAFYRQDIGEGPMPAGKGIEVCRNFFDQRPRRCKAWPTGDGSTGQEQGKWQGDHTDRSARPDWRIWNNTFLSDVGAEGKNLYMGEVSKAYGGSVRDAYNNIYRTITKAPSHNITDEDGTFNRQKNLFHSPLGPGTGIRADDIGADPKFVQYTDEIDKTSPTDIQLQAGSPCFRAGVPIPLSWFDPLRDYEPDPNNPTVGAVPEGLVHPVTGLPLKMEEIFGPKSVF